MVVERGGCWILRLVGLPCRVGFSYSYFLLGFVLGVPCPLLMSRGPMGGLPVRLTSLRGGWRVLILVRLTSLRGGVELCPGFLAGSHRCRWAWLMPGGIPRCLNRHVGLQLMRL